MNVVVAAFTDPEVHRQPSSPRGPLINFGCLLPKYARLFSANPSQMGRGGNPDRVYGGAKTTAIVVVAALAACAAGCSDHSYATTDEVIRSC